MRTVQSSEAPSYTRSQFHFIPPAPPQPLIQTAHESASGSAQRSIFVLPVAPPPMPMFSRTITSECPIPRGGLLVPEGRTAEEESRDYDLFPSDRTELRADMVSRVRQVNDTNRVYSWCGLRVKEVAKPNASARSVLWRRHPNSWLALVDAAVKRQQKRPVQGAPTLTDIAVMFADEHLIIPQLGMELLFMPGKLTLVTQNIRQAFSKILSDEKLSPLYTHFAYFLEQEYLKSLTNEATVDLTLRLQAFSVGHGKSRWFGSWFWDRREDEKLYTDLQHIAENSVMRAMWAISSRLHAQYSGKMVVGYIARELSAMFGTHCSPIAVDAAARLVAATWVALTPTSGF